MDKDNDEFEIRSDEQISTWDDVFRNSVLDFSRDSNPVEFVRENIRWFKNYRIKKILDAGCGDGRNLVFLAKQGSFVIGCDFSDIALLKAAKNAQKRGLSNFVLVNSTLEELPFPDESFDAIICCDVIHHLTKPEKVLQELHRTLRRDGIFLANMLASDDPAYGQGERAGPNSFIYKGIYFAFYSEKEVNSLVKPYFQIPKISKEIREDPVHKGFRDSPHLHNFWVVIGKRKL